MHCKEKQLFLTVQEIHFVSKLVKNVKSSPYIILFWQAKHAEIEWKYTAQE